MLNSTHVLVEAMSRKLFTIGHSTHPLHYFQQMLVQHEITAICDVRSVPYSQYNPQFNRESLKESLRSIGIAYVFLGKELGARSDNPNCYVDGKVQYKVLAEEPLFKEGLRRLMKGMELYQVSLMCAERDPLTCHRTILICRELKSANVEINHVVADGSIESETEAERRLLALTGFVPDLLHSERDCLELAYEAQAKRIAYEVVARKDDWRVAKERGTLDLESGNP